MIIAAATTSVWLVIGPALIAGGIGLTSALLSYRSSQAAMKRGALDAIDERAHQRELLVLDHRLMAIETIWQRIFEIERTGHLPDEAQTEIVRAVVWLPENAGKEVLSTVVALREGSSSSAEFESVRKTLQELTHTDEETK